MYNGVGLQTARGSGTNGYVQVNLANALLSKKRVVYNSEADIKRAEAELNRQPNQDILEHNRKRQIELKCADLEMLMETEGFDDETIQKKVGEYRELLQRQVESGELNIDAEMDPRETHMRVKVAQQNRDRMRAALGIKEDFVEGTAFENMNRNVDVIPKERKDDGLDAKKKGGKKTKGTRMSKSRSSASASSSSSSTSTESSSSSSSSSSASSSSSTSSSSETESDDDDSEKTSSGSESASDRSSSSGEETAETKRTNTRGETVEKSSNESALEEDPSKRSVSKKHGEQLEHRGRSRHSYESNDDRRSRDSSDRFSRDSDDRNSRDVRYRYNSTYRAKRYYRETRYDDERYRYGRYYDERGARDRYWHPTDYHGGRSRRYEDERRRRHEEDHVDRRRSGRHRSPRRRHDTDSSAERSSKDPELESKNSFSAAKRTRLNRSSGDHGNISPENDIGVKKVKHEPGSAHSATGDDELSEVRTIAAEISRYKSAEREDTDTLKDDRIGRDLSGGQMDITLPTDNVDLLREKEASSLKSSPNREEKSANISRGLRDFSETPSMGRGKELAWRRSSSKSSDHVNVKEQLEERVSPVTKIRSHEEFKKSERAMSNENDDKRCSVSRRENSKRSESRSREKSWSGKSGHHPRKQRRRSNRSSSLKSDSRNCRRSASTNRHSSQSENDSAAEKYTRRDSDKGSQIRDHSKIRDREEMQLTSDDLNIVKKGNEVIMLRSSASADPVKRSRLSESSVSQESGMDILKKTARKRHDTPESQDESRERRRSDEYGSPCGKSQSLSERERSESRESASMKNAQDSSSERSSLRSVFKKRKHSEHSRHRKASFLEDKKTCHAKEQKESKRRHSRRRSSSSSTDSTRHRRQESRGRFTRRSHSRLSKSNDKEHHDAHARKRRRHDTPDFSPEKTKKFKRHNSTNSSSDELRIKHGDKEQGNSPVRKGRIIKESGPKTKYASSLSSERGQKRHTEPEVRHKRGGLSETSSSDRPGRHRSPGSEDVTSSSQSDNDQHSRVNTRGHSERSESRTRRSTLSDSDRASTKHQKGKKNLRKRSLRETSKRKRRRHDTSSSESSSGFAESPADRSTRRKSARTSSDEAPKTRRHIDRPSTTHRRPVDQHEPIDQSD